MASDAFRLNEHAVSADAWDPGQPLLDGIARTSSHGLHDRAVTAAVW